MLPKQPDRFGVGNLVAEPQPEEAHEGKPVLDLKLGLIVRETVERLQHHDLEHHHRIKGWPGQFGFKVEEFGRDMHLPLLITTCALDPRSLPSSRENWRGVAPAHLRHAANGTRAAL
jgi:hypothetical protein